MLAYLGADLLFRKSLPSPAESVLNLVFHQDAIEFFGACHPTAFYPTFRTTPTTTPRIRAFLT